MLSNFVIVRNRFAFENVRFKTPVGGKVRRRNVIFYLLYSVFLMMTEIETADLENWMLELPDPLKDVPFIYLAIPGSHDSMTYGITRDSGLAPDAPAAARRLWPAFRGTVIRWTKTQHMDVNSQLYNGIRYFDLRFATKVGTHNLFFTHGLYAGEIVEPFNQIKEFLDSHPQEVVILDCQHFYGFKIEDHRKLFGIIINTFGLRICPPQKNLEVITLNTLHRQKQQVIVVYRNEVVVSSGRFWRNGQFPTPWPRQVSTRGLLTWLKDIRRAPAAGFVIQAVLTPNVPFIVIRWRSNIEDSCAKPVAKKVLPWISHLVPGRPPPAPGDMEALRVNVVIADFVGINDNLFIKTIVGLNYKLLF